MKAIFNKLLGRGKNDDVITIVSGLPRSGTSMMMQMLEAGGTLIVTDNIRKSDEDNPRGYYEFEKVKKIKEDVSWLDDCHNKAFKMVSELLHHLPQEKKCKVIFMRRDIEEMLASQRAMLDRLGRKGAGVSTEKMADLYEKHLRNVENWLAKQNNIDVLYVSYNDLLNHPEENARLVSHFLGDRLNIEKMCNVVEKSLYRKRNKGKDLGIEGLRG